MGLSKRDSKLLFELDLDSRQSNLSLARKLRISKNTVASKLERFQREGLIRDFYTVIDVGKLGYRGIRVYIKLRRCPPKKREEVVKYLVHSPITWWVGNIEKEFDIGFVVWIKELWEFEPVWRKFEKKFHSYMARICLCLYTGVYEGTYGFLEPEKKRNVYYIGMHSKVDVTENELRVLKLISNDAQARTVSMASRLGLSPLTVQHCIRRLKNKGIIKGFRIRLDVSSLGYTFYKIDFQISNMEIRERMLAYVLSLPNVIFVDESIGFADLELGAVFKTHGEFREFLDEFMKHFSKSVADSSYFIYLKVHKIKHF
ncbi:MAG: winged helix-turn-helix transcriptional regulator [Candidatus Micrarchaeota archaeon]